MNDPQFTLHEGDSLNILVTLEDASIDSIVCDPPAWINFMGREWDKPDELEAFKAIAIQCLRVLKPGSHALIWALPRTSDLTMSALRSAGFEIRDVVSHLFLSGFPKGQNIGKAIDKAKGAKRKVTRSEVSRFTSARSYSLNVSNYGDTRPTNERGYQIKEHTEPATPEAQQWEGWNTSLKPMTEFWILARKPLSESTVAGNVLAHGTGALNLDACRIAGAMGPDRALSKPRRSDNAILGKGNPHINPQNPGGRWPPHFLASHHPDCEDGEICTYPCPVFELGLGGKYFPVFYAPKPSASERSLGCDGLPAGAPPASARSKPAPGRAAPLGQPRANGHPCVKAVALMSWLCRLITPPGGIVLDPFAGSGSTGVAALAEGFNFIGVERVPAYAEVARARLLYAQKVAA